MMRLAVLCVQLLLLVGCNSPAVRRLQTYDTAVERGARVDRPRALLYYDTQTLPPLMPYAVVVAGLPLGGPVDHVYQRIWRKADDIDADLVIFQDASHVNAGSVSVYHGFGVTSNIPVRVGVIEAICYRACDAELGFLTDKDGVVLTLSGEARRSGLQEGDRILSWNDGPFKLPAGTYEQAAQASLRALNLSVGDAVRLVWVRPGSGRMEGTLYAYESPGVSRLKDTLVWKERPKRHAMEDDDRDLW
ncbi:MAG: hypothetical protein AAF581_19505 [Planctomycetota bacterium]